MLAAMLPGAAAATVAASGGAGGATLATPVAVVHRPLSALAKSVRNDTVASSNWSGYAVESPTQFTTATGSWRQPTAMCPRRGSTYASFWVGIDGYSSGSVEQIGADSDCASGSGVYYAWYEMYPAGSVTLSRSSYPVVPGDTLTATVQRSGTTYTLTLADGTKWTYTTSLSGSNANSSAEWVVEAPEVCNRFWCQLASLTDFGTVNFSGGQAATGGPLTAISTFTADNSPHEIIMDTGSGTPKATPSGLSSGTAFSDTWSHY